jgi:hypothetical protein
LAEGEDFVDGCATIAGAVPFQNRGDKMDTHPPSRTRRSATAVTLRVAERTAIILTGMVMLGVTGVLATWTIEGLLR